MHAGVKELTIYRYVQLHKGQYKAKIEILLEMAPFAIDYHLQSPANSLQRYAAVPVEFLAMLAIETALNYQPCGEFFHRLWRVKDLFLLKSEKGQYLSLLESERERFQVFVDKLSRGSTTHISGLC